MHATQTSQLRKPTQIKHTSHHIPTHPNPSGGILNFEVYHCPSRNIIMYNALATNEFHPLKKTQAVRRVILPCKCIYFFPMANVLISAKISICENTYSFYQRRILCGKFRSHKYSFLPHFRNSTIKAKNIHKGNFWLLFVCLFGVFLLFCCCFFGVWDFFEGGMFWVLRVFFFVCGFRWRFWFSGLVWLVGLVFFLQQC